MTRPALQSAWFQSVWFRCCLVLVPFLAVTGFAAGQNATPPPPPPDTPPTSLQQPAPETNVRAVRLSYVYGSVKVLNDGQVDFQQANLNMPLVQGMKIVTSEDGRAEVQFEDGSVARITPNSSITLTQLSRAGDGTTITAIEADGGLTYYELNGRAGQYMVQFGQDKVAPIDSSIFRVDLDSSPADLAVTHGSVHVTNDADLDVEAHTNQTLQFDSGNPNEYQLLESVAANSWDQWNSDRDEALAQIEQNAGAEGAENPGLSDLDANGDWYDVPGYGMGWTPSGVGPNWDPYGAGYWGYYSGIGYTWISSYPWGWLPYHCGGWNWFGGGFGWMWFPGNCGWGGFGGVGWYPYGSVWTVPPGYIVPRRPQPIIPRNGPMRNPKHGPVPVNALIAVNRGSQFTQQFRSVAGARIPPRVLNLGGQKIAPVEPREGFTSNGQSRYPGSFIRPAYPQGYRPDAAQPVNRPNFDGTRIPQPQPMHNQAPVFRSSPPAYHAPAPAYHAAPPPPPPAFHAPAAAPAGHPR